MWAYNALQLKYYQIIIFWIEITEERGHCSRSKEQGVRRGTKETHLYPEVSASTVLTADFSPQRAFPSLSGCSALELTKPPTKSDRLAEASTNLFLLWDVSPSASFQPHQ